MWLIRNSVPLKILVLVLVVLIARGPPLMSAIGSLITVGCVRIGAEHVRSLQHNSGALCPIRIITVL